MEKFGIFELLDALSAITALPQEEEAKSSVLDSAYLPPDYPISDAQREDTPSAYAEQHDSTAESVKTPRPDQDALAGFYARHNAVAKKAGKK